MIPLLQLKLVDCIGICETKSHCTFCWLPEAEPEALVLPSSLPALPDARDLASAGAIVTSRPCTLTVCGGIPGFVAPSGLPPSGATLTWRAVRLPGSEVCCLCYPSSCSEHHGTLDQVVIKHGGDMTASKAYLHIRWRLVIWSCYDHNLVHNHGRLQANRCTLDDGIYDIQRVHCLSINFRQQKSASSTCTLLHIQLEMS
jgi:hypothetical protein